MTSEQILKIALVGYGKMGREIERLAPSAGCEVVARLDAGDTIDAEALNGAAIAIEFTHPDVAVANVEALLRLGCPTVVGTTGWLAELPRLKELAVETGTPFVWGSNYSIGVHVFLRVVAHASSLIAELDEYDVAVHEYHHRMKADSPSGTALSVARAIQEAIHKKQSLLSDSSHGRIASSSLHVTSTRVGSVPGTHTVTIDSEQDTIELTHRARTRAGFALGALRAARWVADRPARGYDFAEIVDDVIGM